VNEIPATIGQFIELVEHMRYWQNEFFKTRSKEALVNAKDLETLVDQAITDRRNRKTKVI